eukprot:gnl/TRDRNA2_/TRDRNA2_36797_c0_seq1.p1 gnl/TRDRNA2_/TRDRNA2_36797_c0~~gnl/TRDRNA2_/TRDRNA2_36797_c0_seq1.p1  ORF type:complete len:309 (+),score=51.51 gnl/TRDRNA2_/TRDRNA2_36797_c0_seq1:79-1005(+)
MRSIAAIVFLAVVAPAPAKKPLESVNDRVAAGDDTTLATALHLGVQLPRLRRMPGWLPPSSRHMLPSFVAASSDGESAFRSPLHARIKGTIREKKEEPPKELTPNEKWKVEYKGMIDRVGDTLAGMCWKGYQKLGRGALFANYDNRANPELGQDDASVMTYVPLDKWQEKFEIATEEEQDLLQGWIDNIEDYEPDTQYVVIFQSGRVMGSDIVEPETAPKRIARQPKFKQMMKEVSSRKGQRETSEGQGSKGFGAADLLASGQDGYHIRYFIPGLLSLGCLMIMLVFSHRFHAVPQTVCRAKETLLHA